MLFHAVFGKRKVLARKPKPWRINLLLELAYQGWITIKPKILAKFEATCKDVKYRMLINLFDNVIPATLDVYAVLFRSGSFNEYVEMVFRIWTFALRWNHKNYNKAPLVFLSDIFYWQEKEHPMLEVVKMFLVNFNDYFVENFHSKIRANTSSGDSVDTIIKQACVLDTNKESPFKEMFHTKKRYPYKPSNLEYLANKTSLFLLDYFHQVFCYIKTVGNITDKSYGL
ncbi:hypothetical protein C2G38_1444600 [Gigaspora rosea]|uniref:Uncharacterized protein n=1 Tax=Gigaspora rosea TaxID=44941 RepID=A0A397V5I3_9GLOM|nr:hypothetical protein C2G38_1444600 [Gigaspora rosea]